jgi:hypothetical protein
MKDRIRAVCAEYLDSNGEFQWPADEAARNKLASRLLGACIVAAIDGCVEVGLSSLEADLSSEQQSKVRRLLFQTVKGVVFSILVKLDQFPCANLDLVVTSLENEERLASIYEGDIYDFHDRLWDWIREFSEFPEEFGA